MTISPPNRIQDLPPMARRIPGKGGEAQTTSYQDKCEINLGETDEV